MRTLTIQTQTASYPVLIGAGILAELKPLLENAQKVALITDENVHRLHYQRLAPYLPDHAVYVTPNGESAKSMATYEKIQNFLVQSGVGRDGLLLAFGGGCVGDVAGFAAATYMRGIPYIQIPTTLLAQDSAVGGKVAINLEGGKNLVGAFYPPKAVLFDVDFLKTLDHQQQRSGLAEMVKHGYIASSEFLVRLLAIADKTQLLTESIQIKQNLVEQDEYEHGVRAYLNFGHTLGHALEKVHPELAHGEAVALGMKFALWLSGLPLGTFQKYLDAFAYPDPMHPSFIDAYVAYMQADKKNRSGEVTFVLLSDIGKPYLKGVPDIREKLTAYFGLRGTLKVASDKSITHRALIFASLSQGKTRIFDPLLGEDCQSTLRMFEALGVRFALKDRELLVESPGMEGFQKGHHQLDAGNSGTTARLLMGLFAGLPLQVTLVGDDSLQSRPMKRVADPLAEMGADIQLAGATLPATIKGTTLSGISYKLPVASAQVKSALMLAALTATGETVIEEPAASRDHTENMFADFGLAYEKSGNTISIQGPQVPNTPGMVQVPGDISSAAFFMVAALTMPGSDLIIEGVGINPTRAGILEVLEQMGADVKIQNPRTFGKEEVGDLRIRYTPALKPFVIEGDLVPRLIDEIPILALLALQAEGTSYVRDARELRVKETDRIGTTVSELSALGGKLQGTEDGLVIWGNPEFVPQAAQVRSHGDHRIAMMLAVAGLRGKLAIAGIEAMSVSYPNFLADLASLRP